MPEADGEGFPEAWIAEKQDLDGKIERLTAFLAGDTFATIDQEDQELLKRQLGYMEQYAQTLGDRIARFE